MKRFIAVSLGILFFFAIGLSFAAATTYQYTISGDGYGCVGGPQGGGCNGSGSLNQTQSYGTLADPFLSPALSMTESDFGNNGYVPFSLNITAIPTIYFGEPEATVTSATFTVNGSSYNFIDSYYLADAGSGYLAFGYGGLGFLAVDYIDLGSNLFFSYTLGAGSASNPTFNSNFQDSSDTNPGPGFFGAFVCPSTANCQLGGGETQPGAETFNLLAANNITFSAQVSTVPEPASLALFGSGLIAVARKVLKRK